MTNLKAIKLSIRKWEGVVEGKIEDKGRDDCFLCLAYSCYICPIVKYTKRLNCVKTPYVIWVNLFKWAEPHCANTPERKEAAMLELMFLYFIYWA